MNGRRWHYSEEQLKIVRCGGKVWRCWCLALIHPPVFLLTLPFLEDPPRSKYATASTSSATNAFVTYLYASRRRR